MADKKFNEEQELEIVKKYQAGKNMGQLVKEYITSYATIRKILRKHDARKPSVQTGKQNLVEFEKRVKSTLWRQRTGKDVDRKEYHTWIARVSELESPSGANYTHAQAVVQASKNFNCLGRLLREYDLRAFDPNPESHPNIKQFNNNVGSKVSVFCEDKKLSYRECLQWALDCAGEFQRTSQEPTTCPCNSAWYLYQQAISDPKDFLQKLGQVESKNTGETQEEKDRKKSTKKSVAEIDKMLASLEQQEESSIDESCSI